MATCRICGEKIEDDFMGATVINKGMDSQHELCYLCLCDAQNNGKVIQCEACGENYTADVLHDEEIFGNSFTPCPNCGKDVVEGLTREEFSAEYRPCRYAVTVRYCSGSRGYIVSVNIGENGVASAMKKLAERVDLSGAMEISIAEVLLEEDDF